ncbi:alpha-galactosidase [Beauveria brongniartii RCEF 3172]|uniref:Alpha-galactosidase n=1 Tax=Beauveria brongniartii RCEF 3172 TaxID=1081107 RepID=A0A167B2D8_9HYPO|nr:alpha-galactosidase [Beauveria brongniartii RCEF 3172]
MPATKRAGRTAANAPSTADTTTSGGMTSAARRTSPFIPTPVERLALGLFPLLLIFGSLFALLSPDTRALTYDAATQSHRAADGSVAPSYFARKSNLFNVYFVKRGWGWTTAALLAFVFLHPAAVGGRWRGGHDISGHVFLLTLGSALLMHEVLWPLARWAGWRAEERCVVMGDGALKGASVEAADTAAGRQAKPALGYAGKFALGVLGLNLWMLLMTAIYFHTWFEKFTGLFTAYIAIYVVYFVPRFVPALRQLIGVPGI